MGTRSTGSQAPDGDCDDCDDVDDCDDGNNDGDCYDCDDDGGRKKSQWTKSQMLIWYFALVIIFIKVVMVYNTYLRWTMDIAMR